MIQMRDDQIACDHGKHGRAETGNICACQGNGKQPCGIGAELCNGWCDEADDDERDTECDQLAEDVFDGDDDHHDEFGNNQTCDDTDDNAKQEPGRQTFQQFHNTPQPDVLIPLRSS